MQNSPADTPEAAQQAQPDIAKIERDCLSYASLSCLGPVMQAYRLFYAQGKTEKDFDKCLWDAVSKAIRNAVAVTSREVRDPVWPYVAAPIPPSAGGVPEAGLATLRNVVECLRETAEYRDEEGEATSMLEDLLASLAASTTAPPAVEPSDGNNCHTCAHRPLGELGMGRTEHCYMWKQEPVACNSHSATPDCAVDGVFAGESVADAALGWAAWCEHRHMTGLPAFLRKVAALTLPPAAPITQAEAVKLADAMAIALVKADTPAGVQAYVEARAAFVAALATNKEATT